MIFKPLYYDETGCAAYLFGCGSLGKCAVVDAHEHDIDEFIEALLDVPAKPSAMQPLMLLNQGRAATTS